MSGSNGHGGHGHGIHTLEDMLHHIEGLRKESINEGLKPNLKNLDDVMAKYDMPLLGAHGQKDLPSAEADFYSAFMEGVYGASEMANKKDMAKAMVNSLMVQYGKKDLDQLRTHILNGEKQEAVGIVTKAWRNSMSEVKATEVLQGIATAPEELQKELYKKLAETTDMKYERVAQEPIAAINEYLLKTPPAHGHGGH